MNDLDKKQESNHSAYFTPGAIPHGIDKLTTSQLFYKKLSAYLLLLYQSYLKGETILEPEIKMALWRMIKFNEEFPTKIRMTQLDYLNVEVAHLDADWDEAKDILFPKEETLPQKPIKPEREKTIKGYKEAVAELLDLNL